MMYLKAFGLWMLLGIVATVCGIWREKNLVPRVGRLRGHQIGTLAVCLLFAGIIATFVRSLWPTMDQALFIGALWLVLTILFEFVFGHYVLQKPWSLLAEDYNIARGRLWVPVLLTEALAPAIAIRILSAQ